MNIKPCPRCGSEDINVRDVYETEITVVECECGIRLVVEVDKEEAVVMWNTRTSKELDEAEKPAEDNKEIDSIIELISQLEDRVNSNEKCHDLVTELKYAAQKLKSIS